MKDDKYYIKLEEDGYYNTIDKRSKDYREYKSWLSSKSLKDNKSVDYKEFKESIDSKPKGLGDTVEKITKSTGIDRVVKFIAGDDCGCEERKDKFNKIWRYKNTKCVSEEDFNYLTKFFSGSTTSVNHETKIRIIGIYNYVFSANENKTTSCSSCVSKIVKQLKKYLDIYK